MRTYMSPGMHRVALKAEEAVLTACKQFNAAGGNPGPTGSPGTLPCQAASDVFPKCETIGS